MAVDAGVGKVKLSASITRLNEGGNRVAKMEENAKKMADSYNAILQKMVDKQSLVDPVTGTPYVPDETIMNTLESSFASLEDQLVIEKNTNQELMTNAYQHVLNCDNTKDDGFNGADGVNSRKSSMEGFKTQHNNCRDEEIDAENERTNKCDVIFQNSVKDGCQTNYQYYTQKETSGLDGLIVDAHNCAGADQALTTKRTVCDQAQPKFESAFCAYAQKLDEVCDLYGSCRTSAENEWSAVNASVHSLEASQKIVLKMLRKVNCYIDTLLKIKTENHVPTQDDIKTCSNLGNTAGGFAAIDVSKLDISYVDYPAVSECDTSPGAHKSGANAFAAEEYSHSRHGGERTEKETFSCR